MVRRSAKMLLALMFLSAAGCSAINDYCLKTETGLRIRDLNTGDERWLAYPVQRDDQESIGD
ncbi:MAG: hypothetical protein ACPGXX_22135, partial [Planctomycetaceae bacterium]